MPAAPQTQGELVTVRSQRLAEALRCAQRRSAGVDADEDIVPAHVVPQAVGRGSVRTPGEAFA